MIGKKQKLSPKLYYHNVNLEERVPADHPLRRIKNEVGFDFVRDRVAGLYGKSGHESVDPIVLLKLYFLLFYENVVSERALMAQLPLRLDWLWFCGYDLDEPTPDHSVLSKARRRWGREAFAEFFERILGQCLEAGLVDGKTVHVDSSMIDADAGKDRLRTFLRLTGQSVYQRLETATEPVPRDSQIDSASPEGIEKVPAPRPGQALTPVDPDARLGRKYGQSTLGYKDHRTVDDRCGIVTATITTSANVPDDKLLFEALEAHEHHTQIQVKTVVADTIYGTTDNYRQLYDQGKTCCIPHQRHGVRVNEAVSHDKFRYDAEGDCYLCPNGQTLKRYDHDVRDDGTIRYRADRAVCERCPYLGDCVKSKTQGRQILRNIDAPYVEWADTVCSPTRRRYLLTRRRIRAEGSFADAANNHGFKRARWRGLLKMAIQNLLIAAIQNLRKLLRHRGHQPQKVACGAPVGDLGLFCFSAR